MDPATRHYIVVDRFFAGAKEMRRELDARLSEARAPFDPSRFFWEHWHVAGQFSQLRTPARAFFAHATIAAFEARLLAWSSHELGLSALGGPPWLSAIIDGGFQALHRDSPNGHFAFSYGLRKSASSFRGGETLLARPELLDYFRHGSHREGRAHWPMFDEIDSRFDRLVSFDARIPHAVRAVEGPRHAKDGRVAIQGWLRADGCVASGGVDARDATAIVNGVLAKKAVGRALRGAEGLASVRLAVARSGRVAKAEAMVDTLVATALDPDAPTRAIAALLDTLHAARFPESKRASRVTAPVLVRDAEAHVPTEA